MWIWSKYSEAAGTDCCHDCVQAAPVCEYGVGSHSMWYPSRTLAGFGGGSCSSSSSFKMPLCASWQVHETPSSCCLPYVPSFSVVISPAVSPGQCSLSPELSIWPCSCCAHLIGSRHSVNITLNRRSESHVLRGVRWVLGSIWTQGVGPSTETAQHTFSTLSLTTLPVLHEAAVKSAKITFPILLQVDMNKCLSFSHFSVSESTVYDIGKDELKDAKSSLWYASFCPLSFSSLKLGI